jgi:hypothetical protein
MYVSSLATWEEFHIASVNWDHFASGIVGITVKCGPIEYPLSKEGSTLQDKDKLRLSNLKHACLN